MINLASEPARWESFCATNAFLSSNCLGIDAVDGRKEANWRQYLSRWTHVTHEPSKFDMKQAIGCFLSHQKCWQHAVDHKLPYALMLEDDALMTIEAASFLEAYENNPLPFD